MGALGLGALGLRALGLRALGLKRKTPNATERERSPKREVRPDVKNTQT